MLAQKNNNKKKKNNNSSTQKMVTKSILFIIFYFAQKDHLFEEKIFPGYGDIIYDQASNASFNRKIELTQYSAIAIQGTSKEAFYHE